jgi:hypothetical protein
LAILRFLQMTLETMKELFGIAHVVKEEVPNVKRMRIGEEEVSLSPPIIAMVLLEEEETLVPQDPIVMVPRKEEVPVPQGPRSRSHRKEGDASLS